jgi:hypothetical protein
MTWPPHRSLSIRPRASHRRSSFPPCLPHAATTHKRTSHRIATSSAATDLHRAAYSLFSVSLSLSLSLSLYSPDLHHCTTKSNSKSSTTKAHGNLKLSRDQSKNKNLFCLSNPVPETVTATAYHRLLLFPRPLPSDPKNGGRTAALFVRSLRRPAPEQVPHARGPLSSAIRLRTIPKCRINLVKGSETGVYRGLLHRRVREANKIFDKNEKREGNFGR